MKTQLLFAAALLTVSSVQVVAEPEKSYQGGKAAAHEISGYDHKVDDRGFGERAADKMKELGARAGGGGNANAGASSGGGSAGGRSDAPISAGAGSNAGGNAGASSGSAGRSEGGSTKTVERGGKSDGGGGRSEGGGGSKSIDKKK